VIRTQFTRGTLKVGDIIVPGRSEDSIVLCAHLDHPGMANDDLSGIVVGMDVMRALRRKPDLHYTYRFLIVPETIGSVAFLSHHEDLIPRMKGGLFMEMVGLENPPCLQLSFRGTTEMDRCLILALHQFDPRGWTGPWRTLVRNDERQFDAPGLRIPMLSLQRTLPPAAADWPFREYHTSHDNPGLVSRTSLEATRDLVLEMVETLEANVTPVNLYKGEVFCSRYGIHVAWNEDPQDYGALFNVMDRIDGTRSVAVIAEECRLPFRKALRIIEELHHRGLVRYERP
jgi:aminopeptidase-like protein